MRTLAILDTLVVVTTAGACGWNDDNDSRAATAGLPSTLADVEAHDWLLDRDDSSLTVDDDNTVTLSVTGDELSGRGPCNAYHGTFDIGADASVEIGALASTQMACPGSAMDAETEYFRALEAVDHASVDVDEDGRDDRDRLVLTGDGDVRLSYTSIDTEDLLVGEWDVTGVNTGDAIVSMVPGSQPTLTFSDDGTLLMLTGCNNIGGEWELDGQDLTIETGPRTMMACDDPPGVTQQENALADALDATARVEVAPGSLTLLDGQGRIAITGVQE